MDLTDHRPVNILTIDLEDYFQVSAFDEVVGIDHWPAMESRLAASTDRLLELLDAAHVRATFFVLGWNAERLPQVVQRVAAAGHEIASHGYAHRLVYTMTPDQFRADLQHARESIGAATGVFVTTYRAPSFSITADSLWALDVLIDEHYDVDSSIFPVRHDRYGLPGAPRELHLIERGERSLWELPPCTVHVAGVTMPAAGGGYLRLLPYWWSHWAIQHVNNEGHVAVVYTHPWEIDPEQPRLEVSPLTRLRHYSNLSLMESRVSHLLASFRFAPIREVFTPAFAAAGPGTPLN